MNTGFLAVAVALGAAMLLSLYRVLRGPTTLDRLTGFGLIGSKAIVLLLVLGELAERVELFVDISLSYAMISFVGSIALAKYFEQSEGWQ